VALQPIVRLFAGLDKEVDRDRLVDVQVTKVDERRGVAGGVRG
jgi:hypothetical protein